MPDKQGELTLLDCLDMSQHLEKDDYQEQLITEQARLSGLMRDKRMRRHSLIAVFEGNDAAGKGGSIRRVAAAGLRRARGGKSFFARVGTLALSAYFHMTLCSSIRTEFGLAISEFQRPRRMRALPWPRESVWSLPQARRTVRSRPCAGPSPHRMGRSGAKCAATLVQA